MQSPWQGDPFQARYSKPNSKLYEALWIMPFFVNHFLPLEKSFCSVSTPFMFGYE